MLYSLGQHVYRRRWAVLIFWGILLALSLPLAARVGGALQPGGFSNPHSEGQQGFRILQQEMGNAPSNVTLVFTSDDSQARDQAYRHEVERVLEPLRAHPDVRTIVGYATTGNSRFISQDGRSTYVLVGLNLQVPQAQRAMPELRALLPDSWLRVLVTGGPAAYADIELVSHQDLQRAEIISLPLALIALVIVFRSSIAAAAPVLVGGTAVIVTLACMFFVARFAELSIFVQNITTMLGLGISIDYALFIVSRFREEMAKRPPSNAGATFPEPLEGIVAADNPIEHAIATTVATAGRAVLVSGLTVCIGLLALLLFDYMIMRSIGIGGGLVAIIGVLANLTLLPALLSVLGPRIERLALRPMTAGSGWWHTLSTTVARRPLLIFSLLLPALLLLGAPFLRVRLGAPDVTVLPAWVESRQGFDLLRSEFGQGEVAPIIVVVEAPEGSVLERDRIGALYDYTRAVQQLPGVVRVESIVTMDPGIPKAQYQALYARPDIQEESFRRAVELLAKGRVTLLTVVPSGGPATDEAQHLVRQIRAVPMGDDLRAYVGGGAAELMDVVDDLYGTFPKALAVIVVVTLATLFVQFRSVVLPAKAVLMDTLSIAASYGALVLIFQDGHLRDLLRFTPEGFVDATTPIVMFCVLFGLSMDYEVFMLSRIQEAYNRRRAARLASVSSERPTFPERSPEALEGPVEGTVAALSDQAQQESDNAAAVAEGLEETGHIITSAALIIVLVTASFALADIIVIKALGVGVAIAIFLDATVVRALLVPATMHLLGRWNWWSPLDSR